MKKPKAKRGTCQDCGCTDRKGCIIDREGRTCHWANKRRTLCTSCLFDREEAKRLGRKISAAVGPGMGPAPAGPV